MLLLGQNGIDDVFNPFVMDLSVNTLPRNAVTGNGNEPLQDLSSFPVVTLTGPTQIEVNFNNSVVAINNFKNPVKVVRYYTLM